MKVAALYVDPRGCYENLPSVDAWTEGRDARKYAGPWPVVAHPPCTRWCQLAYVVQKRYGHRVGDDGGCFAAALAAVRTYGGVLEHPAFSYAWPAFGLPRPDRAGGWTSPDAHGGRACHVEQGNYGHRARKATWLYVISDLPTLPELRWGRAPATHAVSYCKNHGCDLPRLSKREASATPHAFRAQLLQLARNSRPWMLESGLDGEASET